MDNRPQIHGSPGESARFSGLLRASLPLAAVLVLGGYTLGALVPWGVNLPFAAKGGLVLLLAAAIFFATSATQGRVDAFFKGARGEEHIALALATLPAGYTVLHGVTLGHAGLWGGRNLDHVVVGPTGVTLIETKNWQGKVALNGGRLTINGADPSRPPLDQVRSGAQELSDWLVRRLPARVVVRPLLCFAGDSLEEARLTIDEITICRADHLVGTITMETAQQLAPATCERISGLLAKQV